MNYFQGLENEKPALKCSSINKLLNNLTTFIDSVVEVTTVTCNWQQLVFQMNTFFNKIYSYLSTNNSVRNYF